MYGTVISGCSQSHLIAMRGTIPVHHTGRFLIMATPASFAYAGRCS
jgi:hypothetical protein